MKYSQFSLWSASRLVVCALFSLMISATAFAHTALTEATPGDGAVIKEGPAHINLTFNGPVKLVKLQLMGVGHEMPTNFESNSEAKAAFMIETPGMHPGEFTVNWAVIGADGHTVANSYSFTVDPSVAEEHAGESASGSH
ncbi:MAG: copper resistance protein CopC [Gammaproteobacteria bacterium]|nr:copper resistance protein CopC [Gammaproteobacteria bacterium]